MQRQQGIDYPGWLMGLVYTRRFYGKEVGNPMSQCMEKNGPDIEQQLMQFDAAQVVASVKK